MNAGLRRESQDGRGDRWEAARKVSAIPAIDGRGETRFVQLHEVAVEFQFIEPTSPVGGDALSFGRAGGMN